MIKKIFAVVLTSALCIGLLVGYVWYKNIFIYQPRDLTVNLTAKESTAKFVGTSRQVEHAAGEQQVNGRLYIGERWYPVDVTVASKNSAALAYLYNEDGTYFATARIYWNAGKITVYRLQDEKQSVYSSKDVLELEKA